MEGLSAYHDCDFCQTMVIDPTRKRSGSGEEAPGDIFFFKPRLASLLSASSTCRFSQWLIDNWSAGDRCDWKDLKSRSEEISLCMDYLSYSFETFPLVEIAWIGLWDPKEEFDQRNGRCRIRSRGYLDVIAHASDPASKFVNTRPINRKIGSQENLNLARRWIAQCLGAHERCPKQERAFIPKRVLKVNQTGLDQYCVALHYPSSPEPYTALSYCWGGDQPHKTTSARIKSRDYVSDWDVLPASIQDAVKVTVGLGYGYLWVDSLCIVQDDDDDKAKQIALMPKIYQSAVVTIVASRARRAIDGFLHDIDVDSITEMAFKLPFQYSDSTSHTTTSGTVYVVKMQNAGEPEPIDYRGWTLQERYLSPRILEYTSKQLLWACASSGEEKGYSDGWRVGTRQDDLALYPVVNLYGSYSTQRTTAGVDDNILNWRVLLQIYTRRALTFPKDRILAISGVAEIFSQIIQDRYFAGLWRQSLPYDLLWNIVPGTSPQSRPTEYRAPSWSWAAPNGEISFNCARSARPSEHAPPEPVITHLEVHTELEEPTAIFGAVTSGYVRGRGRIRNGLWFGNDQPNSDRYHILHEIDGHGTPQPIPRLRMMPDAREKEFAENPSDIGISTEVHLLLVGVCAGIGLRGLVGIVLRELPLTGGESWRRFTRMGIFHIYSSAQPRKRELGIPFPSDNLLVEYGQDYFDDCVPESFEII